MRRFGLLFLILGLPGAAAALATIGPQANCTYQTGAPNPIQQALDAGHTDIRLVGGQSYNGSLMLGGSADVVLRGGYLDCAQALAGTLPGAPQRSIIVATAALSAAISIPAAGTRRRGVVVDLIELRPNLEFSPTGAGLVVAGTLDVILRRSRISGFAYLAGNGGGAIVSQGLLYLQQSEISGNSARNGGGLACIDGDVALDAASRLLLNAANGPGPDGGFGGGAWLDGCHFRSEGRVLPSTLGGTSGIIANSATRDGGGLFVRGGTVSISGGPLCALSEAPWCLPRLAILGANQAGRHGGALFATDAADLSIDFAQVSENQAALSGGAVRLEGVAALRMGGLASLYPSYDRSHCVEGICEVLIGNRLSVDGLLTGEGGAFSLSDAQLVVADALMRDHSALSGSVIHAAGDSNLLLQQIRVDQRIPAPRVTGASSLLFGDTTEVEIRRSSLRSDIPDELRLLRLEDSAELRIEDSVVLARGAGMRPLSANFGTTVSGACNAYAGLTDDAVFEGRVVEPDDFDADGWTPSPTSVLLDQCDAAGLPMSARDIVGTPRALAQSPATLSTPMDIGANERPTPILFGNGFE